MLRNNLNLHGRSNGDTFHKAKYYVSFKRGVEDVKKDITITIDKVFEEDSLKILLSDDGDPSFLCVLTVTRPDYEDLKKLQGLLIDFDNFPAQLVRLLQQCASNNMFLILQQSNPLLYYFEIVEHNEFKRLVHLSLKTGPATDADIKRHMAQTISNLKKSLESLKNTTSTNESVWNDKCISMERRIHDLTISLSKMEEEKLRRETEYQDSLRREKDRLAQEHSEWQNRLEEMKKTQSSSMQETIGRKDRQIDELNSRCRQLKDNIGSLEGQLGDKAQRMSVLEKEVQKSHIEVATVKAKNSTLEREVIEREKQIHHYQTKCMDLDKVLKENQDKLHELERIVHSLKREKTDLQERLRLSDALASTNTQAAQNSSEQLLKANQIISKLNSDLLEIKEKLLCRTAIALEQEKVIENNVKEIEDLKSSNNEFKQQVESLKTDIENLQKNCQTNESALKDKDETIKNNNMVIQWLHKKLEDNCLTASSIPQNNRRQGATTITSSTPYFLPNSSNDTSHNMTDEMPNFYATSRLSETDRSPETLRDNKGNKSGLDPKYLRPAQNAKPNSYDKTVSAKSGNEDTANGKENKSANLPKVDYRETKSGKTVSYRATPVSAYFPYKS